ncbi:hypothetical protein SAMN05518672_1011361 [Chitinophaga sp. CF118]|uniref:hypothetical protein n=1 Tax=Chitinophaga sp. CF118 TaxID=1884367 RepID=UPI0008ECA640|nr:hypothetical protein [Chitinophaga sp. CF118]SFD26729.1 hypothetical protein SAMN05518672_1011361 [Chitinophaga sp. CF118]
MLPPFKHTISDTIYVDKAGFTFRLKIDANENVQEVEVYFFLFRPDEEPVFRKIDPIINFDLKSDNINHPYTASGSLLLQYDNQNRINKIWGLFRYGNEVMHDYNNEMLAIPIPIEPFPPYPPYPDNDNEEVIIDNINYFDLCHFKTIRPPADRPVREVPENYEIVPDHSLLAAASNISVPSSVACLGYIGLLGIGELLVIKQSLLGYEEGDVAFVENVMMYQIKTHTDKQEEEQRIIYKENIDTTSNEEEELIKSEGYDIGQEIGTLAASDNETFSYDPNITKTFSNTSEVLTGGWTLTLPTKDLVNNLLLYVRNLTGRASHQLKQKVSSRYERSALIRKTSIDVNKIDNRGNDANIRGIYRWVNKVFSTSLINYGRRIIIEFGVPDPAASFRNSDNLYNIPAPPKSLPPAFSYGDITRDNYLQYVSDYNIKDFPQPPEANRSVLVTLQNMPQQANTFVRIPDGYVAGKAVISYIFSGTELIGMVGDSFFSNASPTALGDAPSSPPIFPSSMSKGTEEIVLNNVAPIVPVSVMCNANFYTVNVDVTCNCAPDVYERWQVQFFQLVVITYEKLREEYFKKKDLKEIWMLQRTIEKGELKRGCMQLLATYGNIPWSFFEQAFEWDKMTYTFFKYCVQQESGPEWNNIHQELYRDPEFNKFLEAESAKVVLAVRRGYEMQVLNFLYRINAEKTSPVSEQYLNYCYEIERMEDREVRIGEPWNIVVPTSMTILQDGQDLPIFLKQIT